MVDSCDNPALLTEVIPGYSRKKDKMYMIGSRMIGTNA